VRWHHKQTAAPWQGLHQPWGHVYRRIAQQRSYFGSQRCVRQASRGVCGRDVVVVGKRVHGMNLKQSGFWTPPDTVSDTA
jgi:hypothetical protein